MGGRRRTVPGLTRHGSFSQEGNDNSNSGFPFPAAFSGGTADGIAAATLPSIKGSFLGRSSGPITLNSAKLLSNNRFVFQGLGAEENSQSNAGGGTWSEHVKRLSSAPDAGLDGRPTGKREIDVKGQGLSGMMTRTLWAGLAANRFKRPKQKHHSG